MLNFVVNKTFFTSDFIIVSIYEYVYCTPLMLLIACHIQTKRVTFFETRESSSLATFQKRS